MTVVKICGVTSLDQALWALESGAGLVGFVLAPSRRQLLPESVAEIVEGARHRFPPSEREWKSVGVYANQPPAFLEESAVLSGLDIVQLSGQEPAGYCRQISMPVWKVIHISAGIIGPGRPEGSGRRFASWMESVRRTHGAARVLLDSGGSGQLGGSGTSFDWRSIGLAAREAVVAGGLSPSNVAEAIGTMRPWGVDVSSGVEIDGAKDRGLIRAFVEQVRRSDDRAGNPRQRLDWQG